MPEANVAKQEYLTRSQHLKKNHLGRRALDLIAHARPLKARTGFPLRRVMLHNWESLDWQDTVLQHRRAAYRNGGHQVGSGVSSDGPRGGDSEFSRRCTARAWSEKTSRPKQR